MIRHDTVYFVLYKKQGHCGSVPVCVEVTESFFGLAKIKVEKEQIFDISALSHSLNLIPMFNSWIL